MAKAVGPTQADILFNETAVLAARSRRILQSLLGPSTNGNTAETEEELDEEDAEIFKPEPDELLGPGFPAPGDGGPLPGMQNVQTLQADERLRKQMLGKNAKRLPSGKRRDGLMVKSTKINATVPMQPRPAITNQRDDSDDEGGRSSLGKTKKRKIGDLGLGDVGEKEEEESEGPTISEATTTLQTYVPGKAKKKTGSYLDEILSEKSKKKAKKKRRSAQHAETKWS